MQLFLLVFSVALLVLYAALLLYYRAAWQSVMDFKPTNLSAQHTTHISVIIPARNEAKNLPALLRSLLAQTYPTHLFEVLIIDDHSTDDTASIINSYQYQHIKYIPLRQYIAATEINSYKKKAIETGISLSTGSLIVTTDADCYLSPNWLHTIASFYEQQHPAFIAAPVSINCSMRFIELFQALDFMVLQGITGASVHKKMHSMCNGANMAYEKSAFIAVNGFEGIDNIASGDDMLLMHKIYKRYPQRVLFLKSADAIVSTAPVKTIAGFFNQRIRWASKADKYDDKRIFWVLLLVYLLNVLLFVLPVACLFNNSQYPICKVWLMLLALKTITELSFLFPVAKFFQKQWLLWLFPFMQPFHILYTIIAGWLGKFGSYRWKERKVN
jgi:glycosyltransferase involved in cell wall biosynthesis